VTIGQRLKDFRKKSRLTQVEFAKALHCSQATIADYEKDRMYPSATILNYIVRTYDINLNWLFTGKGEMIKPVQKKDRIISQLLQVESDIFAGDPINMKGLEFGGVDLADPVVDLVDNYHYFRVNGSDMEPEYKNNDFIVFKKDSNWLDKESTICAIRIDGKLSLKRVTYDHKNEMIILTTNRKDDQPLIINPKQSSVVLIGRYHYMQRGTSS
jgi:transcriptional regulator with XRE-family HTH domain